VLEVSPAPLACPWRALGVPLACPWRALGGGHPLAAPQLGSCASSGRAWRLRVARHSQVEAGLVPAARPAIVPWSSSSPPLQPPVAPPFVHLRYVVGCNPQERHVVGCNPLQLRAAFEHLRALVSIVVVLRERWHRKYIIGTLRAAATKVADRDPTACALSLLPAVCLPFACLLPASCLPFAYLLPAFCLPLACLLPTFCLPCARPGAPAGPGRARARWRRRARRWRRLGVQSLSRRRRRRRRNLAAPPAGSLGGRRFSVVPRSRIAYSMSLVLPPFRGNDSRPRTCSARQD
jgi:hypothetical protein